MDDEKFYTRALSPSEKDNMIAFLASAFARNKIDLSEYERRLDLLNNINTREGFKKLTNDLIIDSREITEIESIALKMENKNFSRSILVTKKLIIEIEYSTIVLDYSDIDLPDGNYEIQLTGKIANITIKLPNQYIIENNISSTMVSINEAINENVNKSRRNVVIKLTGKLKTSEINIIRTD